MSLLRRLQLAIVWRHAFNRVHAELASYSPRELAADLRLSTANVPELAAAAADQEVADYVRSHPAYRGIPVWRGGLAASAG